jgi:hypothetical protein
MNRNSLSVALSATALVIAVAGAGGPAIAGVFATNSDKVDGKHAVGATASTAQRKGKLVATNRRGKLPNNIIVKAPDAGKVDGIDSSALLRKTGPAGMLRAVGQIYPDGTLVAGSQGVSGVTHYSAGSYGVAVPGADPGCAGALMPFVFAPFAVARIGTYSTSCASGDVNFNVITANSAGTSTDAMYSVAVYSGRPPAAARRTHWTSCTTTATSTTCH